eukprot:TRINITY_DN42251_c0_g1_i1.p1 TRINITY_DN42251_c0_g1~~TRINITY_DN42251_c0_g1_i1.p1  ORF type:complete len:414 (+),score=88.33 TRINITY_DN42251_c0_g1_i1:70-1311(+)
MKSAATVPPAPPGLENLDLDAATSAAMAAAREVKPLAMIEVEEKLKQLVAPDAIKVIRETVLTEVERKVQEKTEELWEKGRTVVSQMQQRHKEKTKQLEGEISQCQQKERALADENERLKQLLQGLAARFSMLETGYMCKDPATLSPDVSSLASTMAGMPPSPLTETGSQAFSPPCFTPGNIFPPGGYAGATSQVGLPDLPLFPFPAAAAEAALPPVSPAPSLVSPAPPLSLAEALDSGSSQLPQLRTPLSLASSLAPPESPPWCAPGLSMVYGVFSFNLRKADGAELGLSVSHMDNDNVLQVEGVRPEGAVEAWNRQCATTSPEKAIFVGDRIVSVNSIYYNTEKMLEECCNKQLLKLTIVRGNAPLPANPNEAPASKHELRADASEFVPGKAATDAAAATAPGMDPKSENE